jgi:hypothetical protein
MTREEHVAWCKERALAYLPAQPQEGITSMLSDMSKHPDTKPVVEAMAGIALFEMMNGTPASARSFIEGFN